MYYFTIEGIECHCETADELRAVVGRPVCTPARPRATTTAKAKRGRAKGAATRVSHHRRPTEAATEVGTEADTGRNSNVVKELPYVKGGITWAVAKKYGKKLGRTDIRQLRSDLKARQMMGK